MLLAAYGGLRFGELAALRRARVDVLRGRVLVCETLVDLNSRLSFGPTKTRRGRRTVPLPRSTVRELTARLETYTGPGADALVFTGEHGQPLRRAGFRRSWWLPAVRAAGLAPCRPPTKEQAHDPPPRPPTTVPTHPPSPTPTYSHTITEEAAQTCTKVPGADSRHQRLTR